MEADGKTSRVCMPIRPDVKIRILGKDDKPVFGQGPSELLALIDERQSVRQACSEMGMSYSKGWKMISNIENALGCQLIHRQQGGKSGGCSNLTPEGKALLETYLLFEKKAKEQVMELFEQYFNKFPEA